MNFTWKHKKTISEQGSFEIEGLNIWEHKWIETDEKAIIKDPLYGKDFIFNVYKIIFASASITFVAGEFSNGVWGIYQRAR
jgi:hypothetical protein